MKTIIRVTLFLITVFLTAGLQWCEFEPTGSYYNDIDTISHPNVSIDLNVSGDTIMVSETANLEYNLDIGERYLYEVNIFVDDSLVSTMYEKSMSVYFPAYNYPEGLHILTIQASCSSETESLADHASGEHLVIRRSWIVIIDRSPPEPIHITSIQPEDGRLKITWDGTVPDYKVFKRYDIYQINVEFRDEKYHMGSIYDRHQTSFIDSSYVGGSRKYQIVIVGQNLKQVESEPAAYSAPFPGFIEYEVINPTSITMKWTRCQFYSNFGNYVIRKKYGYSDYATVATISDISDTTWIDTNTTFGDSVSYLLCILRKTSKRLFTSNTLAPNTSNNIHTLIGYSFGRFDEHYFDELYYNKLHNIYYAYYSAGLDDIAHFNSISAENFEIIGSKDISNPYSWLTPHLDISANGEYAYIAYHDSIFRIDPITLETIGRYNTGDIVGYEAMPTNIQVDNYNRVVFGSYTKAAEHVKDKPQGVILYDMNSEEIISEFSSDHDDFYVDISPDGGFITSESHNRGATMYQFDGTQISEIGPISRHGYFWDSNDGVRWIETVFNTGVIIRDCHTLNIIAQIPIDSLAHSNIDPGSGLLGCLHGYHWTQPGFYSLYNLYDGQLVKTYMVNQNANYKLLNNTLFSHRGYYLPLEIQ